MSGLNTGFALPDGSNAGISAIMTRVTRLTTRLC
jgi:hypothetical protein